MWPYMLLIGKYYIPNLDVQQNLKLNFAMSNTSKKQ